VTGATGGLGYEIALSLARESVDVIVAGPDEEKGREALRNIRQLAPEALVRFEPLDMASLRSVAAFARRLTAENRPLYLLINNAAGAPSLKRRLTVDGIEMQFAKNYLNHFALTGLLLPLLLRSKQARVVQLSSPLHRFGAIHFDNLQGERVYRPWTAYSQSKLAMLLFTQELHRQSEAQRWGLLSSAAHPGYAQAEPVADRPDPKSLLSRLKDSLLLPVSHSPAEGARPILFAATSGDAIPGEFYGPSGFLELTGPPAKAHLAEKALDQEVARRLWQVSVRLAGVKW
jgi:NAD(P)-dependent dehydrogenase (short-subunit alcohol dehydrogenase family)